MNNFIHKGGQGVPPYWKKVLFNSGDVFLPEPVKNFLSILVYKYPNDEKNYTFYIQNWTFIHFINGIIFGYLYLYFNYNKRNYYLNMFLLHTLWETWQVFIGMSKPWKITGRNNIVDTGVDTIAFMIGAFISKRFLI
jgi:hypothetical protein